MQRNFKYTIMVLVLWSIAVTVLLLINFNKNLALCKKAILESTIEVPNKVLTTVKEPNKASRLTIIIKRIQPKLDERVANIIATTILYASESEDVDYALITALIFSESSFDQMAESKIGAAGLMQICYGIWKDSVYLKNVDKRKDIFGIETNITCGVKILKSYIDSSASIEDALVKYTGYKKKNEKTKSIIAHACAIRSFKTKKHI